MKREEHGKLTSCISSLCYFKLNKPWFEQYKSKSMWSRGCSALFTVWLRKSNYTYLSIKTSNSYVQHVNKMVRWFEEAHRNKSIYWKRSIHSCHLHLTTLRRCHFYQVTANPLDANVSNQEQFSVAVWFNKNWSSCFDLTLLNSGHSEVPLPRQIIFIALSSRMGITW